MNRIIPAILVLAAFAAGCGSGHVEPRSSARDRQPVNEDIRNFRPRAVEIIESAVNGEEALLRVYAAEIIAEAHLREFVPELRRMLEDENVPVRFAAAMAFGDMNHVPARAAIERAIRDPDPNVRVAAAYAMVRFGYDKYEKRIYEALSDPDQTLRANAALVLGKLGRRSSITALDWMMRDRKSNEDARIQATYSLAMIGHNEVYTTLWSLLISSYVNYRILGIEGMAALDNRQAMQAIQTMLDDEVLDVRLAAAEKLGAMGDSSGDAIVLAWLRRPPPAADRMEAERRAVRAANAIGNIGTPQLTAYLPVLLEDNSDIVALAAARAVLKLAR